jgi:hypothetical protein
VPTQCALALRLALRLWTRQIAPVASKPQMRRQSKCLPRLQARARKWREQRRAA